MEPKVIEKLLVNDKINKIHAVSTTPWTWGPFLESPVNFSGPNSNIQIEMKRIRARVLSSKLLHFVFLTDSFIMLDAKLLKPRSLMETETAR